MRATMIGLVLALAGCAAADSRSAPAYSGSSRSPSAAASETSPAGEAAKKTEHTGPATGAAGDVANRASPTKSALPSGDAARDEGVREAAAPPVELGGRRAEPHLARPAPREKSAPAGRGGLAASESPGRPMAGSGGGSPAAGFVNAAPPPPVQAPAMRAGRHDDNAEYNRFVQFLGKNAGYVVYPVNVSERLVLRTVDADGRSLANCSVAVKDLAGKVLSTTTTYADGRTQFFPADASPASDTQYTVTARCGSHVRHGQLARRGRRQTTIEFSKVHRHLPAHVPLDIAIVLDTTGSMQGQIDRLTHTLDAIDFQLTHLATQPDIRFGLVAYRDRGDVYVTRTTPFTADVSAFHRKLAALEADGGGDTPEDMQAALAAAMHELKWRTDAIRLAFVISDAPPHTDYGETYTYRSAMREGLQRGIKWITVGAGGLPIDGEVIFRQIAEMTMGEYVFVTQGNVGDSAGGTGEASHHVGTNYHTENLDQAIVRIVRRELSYMTDTPRDFDATIVAQGNGSTPRDELLAPAVAEAVRQLADYSAIELQPNTPVAVAPVVAPKKGSAVAEYLTEQLILTASRNRSFRVVDRDLKAVAQEIKLQLSDLFDVTQAVPIGKMVGADAIIVSKLTVVGHKAELFCKLVRVETGEILSVAKVDIQGAAGV